MPNEIELNPKEQSLIAIGASVAAGCQPCTAYHIEAARTAGACDRGIALAVETAVTGRTTATIGMSDWAARCQGSKPEIDVEFRAQMLLIAELTSIATAVAVNSVPDLQQHLDAARGAGARVEQIRTAIEIARKIKRVAAEKISAITDAIEEGALSATASGGSGCCSSGEANRREIPESVPTNCGCR